MLAAANAIAESRRALRTFRESFTLHPSLVLGFSFFWLWIWLVFQTVLFSSPHAASMGLTLPAWIVPLSAYAITFFILGALFKYRNLAPRRKHYLTMVATAMFLGVLICILLSYWSTGSQVIDIFLFIVGDILMGSGSALLHMEWGRLMGYLGTRRTVSYGIWGTFGAAFLYFTLDSFPLLIVRLCVLCLPVLSTALLAYHLKCNPRAFRENRDAKLHIPRKFLTTSFIQGFSFGIVVAFLLIGDSAWPAKQLSAVTFAAAAVVVLAVTAFYKMDFNQLFYQVGFLLMAVGYLVFAIVGVQSIVGWFIHSVGYRIVDILMWALCAYLIKQKGLPANWVFAWTTCSLLVGQTVGALVGNAMMVYSPISPNGTEILPVLMIFLLLGSALLLTSHRNIQAGWGMVKPGDEDEPLSAFTASCHFVSSEYNLTAREGEVFSLLAHGRNREFICEKLTLSKETVKTHIRNIYHKLGIHSQQDAMSLVETQEKLFAQGDGDCPSSDELGV